MSDDKTEEPTAHKLRKAREEGNVPKSEDLKGFISLVACLGILYSMAGNVYMSFQSPAAECFASGFDINETALLTKACGSVLTFMVMTIGGIFGLCVTVGFVSYFILNGGFLMPKDAFKFKIDSLNFAQNAIGIFKKENLTTALMSVAKEILFYGIFFYFVSVYGKAMVYEAFCGEACSGEAQSDFLFFIICTFLLISLIFSGIDYPLRVFFHKKSLMMDHKEIKEEHKEMEGNPEVKHERENFRWELLNGVPTGPGNATFFVQGRSGIVGIRYVREESPAPMVVALGKNQLSIDKITMIARSRRCLIYKDDDFALGLLKKGQMGRPVALEFVGPIRKAIVALRQHEARYGPSHKATPKK